MRLLLQLLLVVLLGVCARDAGVCGASYLVRLLEHRVYNASATMPAWAAPAGTPGTPMFVAAIDFETPWGVTCNQLTLDVGVRRYPPAVGATLLPSAAAVWVWSNTTSSLLNGGSFAPSGAGWKANVTVLPAHFTAGANDAGTLRVALPAFTTALTRGVYWLGLTLVLPTGTAVGSAELRWMTAAAGETRYGWPYRIVDALGTARPSLPALAKWTDAVAAEPYLMPLDVAGVHGSPTHELAAALYANCTGSGMAASDPRVLAALPAPYVVLPTPTPTPTPTPVPVSIDAPSTMPAPTDTPSGGAPVPTDTPSGGAPAPTDTPSGGAPAPTDTPSGGAPAPMDTPSGGAPAPVPSGTAAVSGEEGLAASAWIVLVTCIVAVLLMVGIGGLYVWRAVRAGKLRMLSSRDVLQYNDAHNLLTQPAAGAAASESTDEASAGGADDMETRVSLDDSTGTASAAAPPPPARFMDDDYDGKMMRSVPLDDAKKPARRARSHDRQTSGGSAGSSGSSSAKNKNPKPPKK